jgi:4-amino-4-deoxy-L-arabinose transferase-like glycosyltransferase
MQTELSSMSSVRPAAERRLMAGWFLVALIVNLAGNGMHSLWDADEPRYATATLEMMQTGDWIVPHLNGRLRFDKPVLIYWLMSAPMRLLGPSAFSARLVSSVAGAGLAALIFGFALRIGCARRGSHLAAACILLTSLPAIISRAATTDASLTLLITGMFYCAWRRRAEGFSWANHLLFWGLMGLAVLLKGPVGPAIVGLALGTQSFFDARSGGSSRHIGPSWIVRWGSGLGLLLAIALPWAIAVQMQTDGSFLRESIGRHVIERTARPIEGKGGNWLLFLPAYVPIVLLDLFPLTAPFLVAGVWSWHQRSDAPHRFLWCWFLPGFLLFTAVQTKLPHYPAPLLPAAILMIALWWDARAGGQTPIEPGPASRWWRAGTWIAGGLGATVIATLPAVAIAMRMWPLLAPLVAMGLALGGGAIAGALLWRRGDATGAVRWWLGGQALFLGLTLFWGLPAYEPLRPSPPVGRWIAENMPTPNPVLAVDLRDDSVLFYAQRRIEFVGRSQREKVIQRLTGATDFIALVITAPRWEEWLSKQQTPLPDRVGVLFRQPFFVADDGRIEDVLIVGNLGPSSNPLHR